MSGKILLFPSIRAAAVAPSDGRLAASAPPRAPLDRAVGSSPTPEDPTVASPLAEPGEARRFRKLTLPHLDSVYAFARHLCSDASLAEALVEDAYRQAFRDFSRHRGGGKAWLLSVVRASFVARLRDGRAPIGRSPAAVADRGASVAAPASGDGAICTNDTGLHTAVGDLPDQLRETLVLRELEQMSYRQIAELTQTDIGAVTSRLAQAPIPWSGWPPPSRST